jgi:hypothetical protein
MTLSHKAEGCGTRLRRRENFPGKAGKMVAGADKCPNRRTASSPSGMTQTATIHLKNKAFFV